MSQSAISKDVVPQVKDWIEGITIQLRAAETERDLLNVGVQYLRIPFVPEVTRACWAEFRKCMQKFEMPGPKTETTIVAVDFPAIFHASFERNKDSLPDVPADIMSRLDSIYADTDCERAELFLLAIDGKDNWRKVAFPGYKAKRLEKPEGFAEAMQDALHACRQAGRVVVEIDRYESDDVLASVSYRAKLRQQAAILVTDDKDAWQCLGMGTVMYSPRTGKYFKEDSLLAQHSITPRQVVDWLALTGKNDVPTAKQIGEKTASELLAAYGNFWGIYEAREQITPARRAGIEAFAKDGYWLARDLHTLHKGLEVHW